MTRPIRTAEALEVMNAPQMRRDRLRDAARWLGLLAAGVLMFAATVLVLSWIVSAAEKAAHDYRQACAAGAVCEATST